MSGLVSIACEAGAKESLRQMGFGRRGQTVSCALITRLMASRLQPSTEPLSNLIAIPA